MKWKVLKLLKRGEPTMKILFVLLLPFVPGLAVWTPDSRALDLAPQDALTGEGTSRGPVGVAVPGGPSALHSRAEIRARARGWELKRLGVCGWKLLLSERCAVRSDLPADDVRAVALHADTFVRAIEGELEGDSSELRFSVRVFRDRHAFDVYASLSGARGAESFYDVRNAEAVLHWPRNGEIWRLLMHELAHAYVDRVFGRAEPLWLTEGIAEYFASYRSEAGAPRPGGPHPALSDVLRRERELRLRELLEADRSAFYGEDRMRHYASAWSLMRFLAAHEDGQGPGALWELVRGKGLHLLCDLDELERRWAEWRERDWE